MFRPQKGYCSKQGARRVNTSLAAGELRSLCLAAFAAAGVPASVAETVVEALLDAELDGISSHGLSRLPFYADQAMHGKVRANAVPVTTNPAPGVVLVDACNGFAFPAINVGLDAALARVAEQGVCSLVSGARTTAAFWGILWKK